MSTPDALRGPADKGAPTTSLHFTRGESIGLSTVFVVVGATVGWVLPPLAGWVATWGWVPFESLVELVAGWSGTWGAPALIGAGALAGAAFTGWVHHEAERLDVTRDALVATSGTRTWDVARATVAQTFYDAKSLVATDAAGAEVWRARPEAGRERVQEALAAHGWPYRSDDPHASGLTRWVRGGVGLPDGADAVLGARERALGAKDVADADLLLVEAGRLGIAVRDVDGRQHWARLSPSAEK